MVMSLNQIMKINRKINIFFLLKKMQIIVVNSLKSLKNLYLCLYRRSTSRVQYLTSLATLGSDLPTDLHRSHH